MILKITKELDGNNIHKGIPPIIQNGREHTSSEAKCNMLNKTLTTKSELQAQKLVLPAPEKTHKQHPWMHCNKP